MLILRSTDTNLQIAITAQTPGTWYYRVRANNAMGNSSWSNVELVTVAASSATSTSTGTATSTPTGTATSTPTGTATSTPTGTPSDQGSGTIGFEGGSVAFDGSTLIVTFPNGAVNAPILIRYARVAPPGHPLPPGRIPVRGFTLEVFQGDQPITTFLRPYTLEIFYDPAELEALGINPYTLNLSYWNEAGWIALLPCAGCGIDPANHRITVMLNHMTEFAVHGADRLQVHLPLVKR